MGTSAPDALLRLVDRFDQDRKVLLCADYKEEQLRFEFLNSRSPTARRSEFELWSFLKAGLTDLAVCDAQAEVFKPVIHEVSIKACPARSCGGGAT